MSTNVSLQRPSKKLPEALALEESVLGALLIERNAIIDVIDILHPNDFHSEQHSVIYEAIRALFQENKAIDARTVVQQLKKQQALEKAGGVGYIAALMRTVASSGHIQDHAHILMEYALRRSIIKIGNNLFHKV